MISAALARMNLITVWFDHDNNRPMICSPPEKSEIRNSTTHWNHAPWWHPGSILLLCQWCPLAQISKRGDNGEMKPGEERKACLQSTRVRIGHFTSTDLVQYQTAFDDSKLSIGFWIVMNGIILKKDWRYDVNTKCAHSIWKIQPLLLFCWHIRSRHPKRAGKWGRQNANYANQLITKHHYY